MSAKRAIGIWLKKIQMAVKVSKPWLAYVLFWWLYSSLLLQERRLIWSRQVLNRPLKALLYHFVYSFNTTTYFTWEYAVWIIIITKLVCWLVICFHLNAFQLWNNHLKHRQSKQNYIFKSQFSYWKYDHFWINCMQDYCEFFIIL